MPKPQTLKDVVVASRAAADKWKRVAVARKRRWLRHTLTFFCISIPRTLKVFALLQLLLSKCVFGIHSTSTSNWQHLYQRFNRSMKYCIDGADTTLGLHTTPSATWAPTNRKSAPHLLAAALVVEVLLWFGLWCVGKRNKYEKHLKRYASAEKINAQKTAVRNNKNHWGCGGGRRAKATTTNARPKWIAR